MKSCQRQLQITAAQEKNQHHDKQKPGLPGHSHSLRNPSETKTPHLKKTRPKNYTTPTKTLKQISPQDLKLRNKNPKRKAQPTNYQNPNEN